MQKVLDTNLLRRTKASAPSPPLDGALVSGASSYYDDDYDDEWLQPEYDDYDQEADDPTPAPVVACNKQVYHVLLHYHCESLPHWYHFFWHGQRELASECSNNITSVKDQLRFWVDSYHTFCGPDPPTLDPSLAV